jgi:signal peptidase I
MTEDTEAGGPQPERWGSLASFLFASFYLWVALWLAAFVAVPAVGFDWEPVVITSGSMEPLIRAGDVVLIDEPTPERLGPGTVVTFDDPLRPGTLTTHRIVGVDADGAFTTRGDANQSVDPAIVTPEAVAGVGRLLVPMIGLPLVWLRGSLLLFVVWAAATVLAAAVATQRSGPDADSDGGGPGPGDDDGDGHGGDGDGPGAEVPEPEITIRLPEARSRVGAAAGQLGPRRVQARMVATGADLLQRALRAPQDRRAGRLVRTTAGRLVAAVTSSRPVAGRVRTNVPLVLAAVLPLATRRPAGVALAVLAPLTVLLLDPRGPEIRIGRVAARARAAGARIPAPPRPRVPDLGPVLRPAAVGLVVVLAGTSVVGRSQAAFSADTSLGTSTISTAPAVCPEPGSTTLGLATADVHEDGSASTRDAGVHNVRGGTGTRSRLLLVPTSTVLVPAGCSVTSATLRVTTGNVDPGARSILLAPLATAVPALLTWATQPPTATPVVTAALTADSTTDIPVTAIAGAWATGAVAQHGLQLRLADDVNAHRAQVRGNVDPAVWRPTLTVTWGP